MLEKCVSRDEVNTKMHALRSHKIIEIRHTFDTGFLLANTMRISKYVFKPIVSKISDSPCQNRT